jgi:4'-phosphopantetheinyl transferase
VLLVDFDFDASLDDTQFDVLSEDERAQASHFMRPADVIRFASSHAALRNCLAMAVGQAAAAIRFSRSAFGRPSLTGNDAVSVVDFNLSHSGNHALIVWSATRRVGVDIEWRRADWAWQALVSGVFGDVDALQLAATPLARQCERFFDIWVAKEALLKASGDGIGAGLADFSVASDMSGFPFIQGCSALALALQSFQARWLRNIDGYAACVAWSRRART